MIQKQFVMVVAVVLLCIWIQLIRENRENTQTRSKCFHGELAAFGSFPFQTEATKKLNSGRTRPHLSFFFCVFHFHLVYM